MKAGEWKVEANISAIKEVTAVEEGKNPKKVGDCHCIIPGNILFLVSCTRSSISFPFSGGLS